MIKVIRDMIGGQCSLACKIAIKFHAEIWPGCFSFSKKGRCDDCLNSGLSSKPNNTALLYDYTQRYQKSMSLGIAFGTKG
jgi:hypothetical protein